LPADWAPSGALRDLAKSLGVPCDVEAEKLRDWAAANAVRKADWDATFRGWLRRASSTPPARTGSHVRFDPLAQALAQAERAEAEEREAMAFGGVSP